MKNLIIIFTAVLCMTAVTARAQDFPTYFPNYTVGVPVDDTIFGFWYGSSNCSPEYDTQLGIFLESQVSGLKFYMLIDSVSNTVSISPYGSVQPGDTLQLINNVFWYPVYISYPGKIKLMLRVTGVPLVASEIYKCGSIICIDGAWSCSNFTSYGINGECNVNSSVSPPIPAVSGYVKYDNDYATPLSNCKVQLIHGTDTLIQTTDNLGFYSFSGVQDGTYQLKVKCNKPWAGVNAGDALKVMQHFVGSSALSPLRKHAAAVAGKDYINAADAFLILKRFAGLTNSFVTGNWFFESLNITVDGQSVTNANLKGICYGDADGSNVPPP